MSGLHVGAGELIGGPEPGSDSGTSAAGAGPEIEARSPLQLSLARLRRDRMAMATSGIILLIILIAIFAPLLAKLTGHGPNQQFRTTGLTPDGLPKAPTGTFWMGTDDLGRDLMVRIAYGARISLLVSIVAMIFTIVIGTLIGLAAGYFGGWVDTILSLLTDVVLSFPFLLFTIALVAIRGASLWLLIIVMSAFNWPTVSRVIRAQTLSLKEREFVEAGLSLGASDRRIIFLDLLPNVTAPLIVYGSLLIPTYVILESVLSFLGLGVPPPTATWGGMMSDSVAYYRVAWWYVFFPGGALLITTLAFNLLGDSIRDAFDPRAGR